MHRRSGTSHTAAVLRARFGESAFTTAQAEQIGVSARRLGIATDAGLLLRVRRGLYLVTDVVRSASSTLDPEASAHAHLVVADHRVEEFRYRGIAAAVGDEAAAAVWDLPHGPLTLATIRVPGHSGAHIGTRDGVRVREGDVGDVISFRGHVITSPLATARDISRGLPRYQAVALFGLAQRRHAEWLLIGEGRMDAGDLTQALADPELRAHLRKEMSRMLHESGQRQHWNESADPRPETYLEGISWGRFTSWRLGDMRPQVWVRGASGRLYRVDVMIEGIAGEADGAVKYGRHSATSPESVLWKEKLRQEDIENGGTPVVRWTYQEAEHHPGALLSRWRRALRRHAA